MSRLSDHSEDPATRPRRKWYQFTLAGVLLTTLLSALALGLYRLMTPPPPSPSPAIIALDIDILDDFMLRWLSYRGICAPSDFTNTGELQAFVQRAFPGANPACIANLPQLSPAEALVFWLGGYWDGKKMIGFCVEAQGLFCDPRQVRGVRQEPLFAFDVTRLFDRDGNGFPEYYPPNSDPEKAPPYVYFAPDRNGNYSGSYRHPGMSGIAMPYRSDDGGFVNAKSFQIISAGLDRNFGAGVDKYFPSGKGYNDGDWDNQTNFSVQPLEDAKLQAESGGKK